jgi:hypothetical protein
VFYGAAGRLNPVWRPCNIGKLGQDNEYYYYYYYQEIEIELSHALALLTRSFLPGTAQHPGL